MSAHEATEEQKATNSADTRVGTLKRDLGWYLFKGSRFRGPVRDGTRCEGEIYFTVGRFGEFRQCESKGKFEYAGHRFCGRHHPPVVDAKEQARSDERARQRAAAAAKYQREQATEKQKDAALEAIKQIAAGHNDPQALSREVLAMHPHPGEQR